MRIGANKNDKVCRFYVANNSVLSLQKKSTINQYPKYHQSCVKAYSLK